MALNYLPIRILTLPLSMQNQILKESFFKKTVWMFDRPTYKSTFIEYTLRFSAIVKSHFCFTVGEPISIQSSIICFLCQSSSISSKLKSIVIIKDHLTFLEVVLVSSRVHTHDPANMGKLIIMNTMPNCEHMSLSNNLKVSLD